MTSFLIIAIIILDSILLVVFLDIFFAFNMRRCPYCGKRMRYVYQKKDKHGDFEGWVFHCPHCGAWDEVTPEELNKERK